MAAELIRLLHGARVEKSHGPLPDVYVFTLFAHKKKRHLLLRCGRRSPLLFISVCRPPNPAQPSARVMRLRKYCAGRRLGRGIADFISRRVAFPIASGSMSETGFFENFSPDASPEACFQREDSAIWLMLDLLSGPDIVRTLPQGFGSEPPWPEPSLADVLCRRPWNRNETQGLWREYAVLTPALRESLAGLDAMEGRALLADLESGGGELFLYADASGRPRAYSAWPLPESVLARRALEPWKDGAGKGCGHDSLFGARGDDDRLREFPALAGIARVDEACFLSAYGSLTEKQEGEARRREQKRVAGLLDKLDQEEERLRKMLELRRDACLLQGVLWRYPASTRLSEVPVDAHDGERRIVVMNPLLSLRDNMARMFRDSARGSRGLEHVRRRRGEIMALQEDPSGGRRMAVFGLEACNALSGEPGGGRGKVERAGGSQSVPGIATEAKRRNVRKDSGHRGMANVARFVSSDGFILLRGKNAEGNQALLQLGQPYDFWMHSQEGPSAHLIVRRPHPAAEIPETTLMEAAAMVGKRSRQRHDAEAYVMVALLRHVHAVKGAEPGRVRVDAVLRVLTVPLDGVVAKFL
jgi:hypothetical protein